MDFPLLLRHRLRELGTEQRDLAAAAQVTESYISQLVTGKKPPPAPERTDIYGRMESFLRLPAGQLAMLANLQRRDALKRKLGEPPAPLFKEVRELILRKCAPGNRQSLRAIFEREPFGALERLVTETLLDVVKRVTKAELGDQNWLRLLAGPTGRSYEQTRVMVMEFLETDVLDVSDENCITFLDPLIESWDFDLATFVLEIVLNLRFTSATPRRFAFIELDAALPPSLVAAGLQPREEPPVGAGLQPREEPGLHAFLEDPGLSADATAAEVAFLRRLTFPTRRPTALYFYRELQNLRDPLHFRPAAGNASGTRA